MSASVNRAAERAAGSPMPSKLVGAANGAAGSAEPRSVTGASASAVVSEASKAKHLAGFMVRYPPHGKAVQWQRRLAT